MYETSYLKSTRNIYCCLLQKSGLVKRKDEIRLDNLIYSIFTVKSTCITISVSFYVSVLYYNSFCYLIAFNGLCYKKENLLIYNHQYRSTQE